MVENPMSLSGRSILVTGASSGIGRETAILASKLGARVILVGRDRGRLEETHARLAGTGHRLEIVDLAIARANIPHWLRELTNEVGPL